MVLDAPKSMGYSKCIAHKGCPTMITTKTAVQCQVSLSLILFRCSPTRLRASGVHFFYVEWDIGGCAANVPFDINK